MRPARYDLRADFTSTDPTFGDSTGTLDDGLTVTLEESTTTYTGPTVIANGGPVTLTALFEEDGANDDEGDSAGIPVAGRTIHFTLGSGITAQTCDGVTNALGIASCTINPVNQPLGPGVVSAAFTVGWRSIESSSDDRGHDGLRVPGVRRFRDRRFEFVDWNRRDFLGRAVGEAQLPERRPRADTRSRALATRCRRPPPCGITLTGTPGNSTHPPATVPAFMGVLVPTAVTQAGAEHLLRGVEHRGGADQRRV